MKPAWLVGCLGRAVVRGSWSIAVGDGVAVRPLDHIAGQRRRPDGIRTAKFGGFLFKFENERWRSFEKNPFLVTRLGRRDGPRRPSRPAAVLPSAFSLARSLSACLAHSLSDSVYLNTSSSPLPQRQASSPINSFIFFSLSSLIHRIWPTVCLSVCLSWKAGKQAGTLESRLVSQSANHPPPAMVDGIDRGQLVMNELFTDTLAYGT